MQTSIYNVETRIGTNGKPYIMEVSPRGGGNRLAECVRYATGIDMITACTRAAVGEPVGTLEQKPYNGHWAEIILHADKRGVFDHLEISKELPAEIVEEDLWVEKGERVENFEGANNAIGTLVLKFKNNKDLLYVMNNICKFVNVKLEQTGGDKSLSNRWFSLLRKVA